MSLAVTGPCRIDLEDPAASSGRGFWLTCGLVALIGVAKAIKADTLDPDAFWHLRVADQLLRDGIGPLVDSIGFASVRTPWTPYSWLAELTMRGVWQIGGVHAAAVVTAACSAAIVLLNAATARRRTRGRNDSAVALLTAAAAYFTLPFVSFRPATFALVLLAAVIGLLVRDRRSRGGLVWAVVPLTAVMTNVHLYAGIAVAAVVLTAAGAWFDDRSAFRRYALLAAATTAASCLTPMLPGVIRTALAYNADDPMVASSFIAEMRPFYDGAGGKVSLLLFAASVGLCVARRRSLAVTDGLWFALGSVLLFRLGRFSPVFAILAVPAVAAALPFLGGGSMRKYGVQVALAVVLIIGVADCVASLDRQDTDTWLNRNVPSYPTAAAAFVERSVEPRCGRIINEFNWGGYLAWRLGGHYRVFMDGRTQLYPPTFWRQTVLGDDTSRRALLADVSADAAVLPANNSLLTRPLAQLGWREAYRDSFAVVMTPAGR